MEERNAAGLTPFHVALQQGQVSILRFFLSSYTPADNETVYDRPPTKSLLSIALESRHPEVVWVILSNKLASKEDMASAWTCITGEGYKTQSQVNERVDEITDLLMTFGGFSKIAEPTPPQLNKIQTNGHISSSPSSLASPQDETTPNRNARPSHRGQWYHNRKPRIPPGMKEPPVPANQQTTVEDCADEPTPSQHSTEQPPLPHGRGRGHGQGRGRGRGPARGFRGRGRNGSFPP